MAIALLLLKLGGAPALSAQSFADTAASASHGVAVAADGGGGRL